VMSSGSAWGSADSGLAAYVNGVQVLVSQWDFTLLFSQASGTPGVPQAGEEPSIQVTRNFIGRFAMSPQHAKAFSELLRRNVQLYEAQYGEIPVLLEEAAVPPPEEVVERVVDTVRQEPESDLPARPPTSPGEPHGA